MALKRINKVFNSPIVFFEAQKCHEKLRKKLLPGVRKFSVFLRSIQVCVSECVTEKIDFLDVSRGLFDFISQHSTHLPCPGFPFDPKTIQKKP
jgi:hypothetical protein